MKIGTGMDADRGSRLLRRVYGFLKPVRRTATIACGIVALRVGAEVVSVYFLSPAFTAIAEGKSVVSLLPAMAISQLALGALMYGRAVWDARFSMNAVFYIRQAVYDQLQHLGLSFHDRMTSGQLINRAISDLQNVRAFLNVSLLNGLEITLTLVAYLTLLGSRSLWLLPVAFLPVPIGWILVRRYAQAAQRFYRSQQEASDQMVGAVTENVDGVKVIRAFGLGDREGKKFAQLNGKLLARTLDGADLQAALNPSLKRVAYGAHIALFVVTCLLIRSGKAAVGDLMILGIAMGSIIGKLQAANSIVEAYQKAAVSAERLFEILDAPVPASVVDGEAGAQLEPAAPGEVFFDSVSFGYDLRRPVLRDVRLRIPARKVTCVLGPTGSGKSTLSGLIARFYEPQGGSVRIDGLDVKSMKLRDLRHTVGYVFQETFLFTDTIRNNIRYGRADVSDEMLLAAARAAHADEFIQTLPQGYDTYLGEGGVQLSGGQRQRLALARALVYDPKILILDDATAALDAKTERTVLEQIRPILADRTVILIAHRLGVLEFADHVIIMENGQVAEEGDPDALFEAGGRLAALWRLHSGPVETGLPVHSS